MDIDDAATYFDDTEVYDLQDSFLFVGQQDIYDRSTSEGDSASRRTITAGPGVIPLPVESVVKINDNQFLTGSISKDSFQGSVIREVLTLQSTNCDAEVFTLPNLINSGAPLIQSDGFLSWRKTQKEEERTAEYFNIYDLYLPFRGGTVAGHVVSVSPYKASSPPILYLVSTVELSSLGLDRVVAYELGAGALQTVSYYRLLEYDPAVGEDEFSAPVSLPMLSVRYLAGYDLESYSSVEFKLGDQVLFTTDTSAISGEKLTLSDGTNITVVSIMDSPHGFAGLRSIHGRRV